MVSGEGMEITPKECLGRISVEKSYISTPILEKKSIYYFMVYGVKCTRTESQSRGARTKGPSP